MTGGNSDTSTMFYQDKPCADVIDTHRMASEREVSRRIRMALDLLGCISSVVRVTLRCVEVSCGNGCRQRAETAGQAGGRGRDRTCDARV
jgi:hypothetical protein